MRAPHRRRPLKREFFAPPGADLRRVAERADYVGSVEHKDVRSFAGLPRPRGDASCCPPCLANRQNRIRTWLRSAIRRGATGSPWEGEFPRYVWHKHGNVVYEGRLVNSEAGSYKGYPLLKTEWPAGIEDMYAGA